MKSKVAALAASGLLAFSLAACSGGAAQTATKAEVTDGLVKALQTELEEQGLAGIEDAVISDYAECIVDKSYDSLSDATRSVLAKGSNEDIADLEISETDASTLEDNIAACQDTLIDALIGE